MGSQAVTGVVHLGLGAFHRAHQACVFDHLMQQGDARWGVFGVAMHNPDVLAALKNQNWQYAVQVASAHESHWQRVLESWAIFQCNSHSRVPHGFQKICA